MIELKAIGASGKGSRLPLEDIDPDVVTAVEDAFTWATENPGDRLEAAFATQEEADVFLRQARDYAYQRPSGRLVVAGNSTQKGLARFRVTAYEAPSDGTPEAGE